MENPPLMDDFPIETSIYMGFPIAVFNYRRVLIRWWFLVFGETLNWDEFWYFCLHLSLYTWCLLTFNHGWWFESYFFNGLYLDYVLGLLGLLGSWVLDPQLFSCSLPSSVPLPQRRPDAKGKNDYADLFFSHWPIYRLLCLGSWRMGPLGWLKMQTGWWHRCWMDEYGSITWVNYKNLTTTSP